MSDKEKLEIALKALEAIINPVTHLKSELKEGETLNGMAMAMVLDKPHFYQNLAQKALEKIKS